MVKYFLGYMHEPFLHRKGYTNDYWENDNMVSKTKYSYIFGREELFASAGPYFQKLWRYQRKLQAQKNKQLIKEGKKPMKLCFHYPDPLWSHYNYRLKTYDEVQKNPFGSLYTHSENIYCKTQKALDRYFELCKTHPDLSEDYMRRHYPILYKN